MKSGDVIRDSRSNFFTPWSLEGSKYDKERRNVAAPVPEMLKTTPKPVVPGKRAKNPQQSFHYRLEIRPQR